MLQERGHIGNISLRAHHKLLVFEKLLCILHSTHVKNLFLDKQVSDELGYLYFKDRKGDTFR